MVNLCLSKGIFLYLRDILPVLSLWFISLFSVRSGSLPSAHIPLDFSLIKKESPREPNQVLAIIYLFLHLLHPPSALLVFSFRKREILNFHSLFPSRSHMEVSPKKEVFQLGTMLVLPNEFTAEQESRASALCCFFFRHIESAFLPTCLHMDVNSAIYYPVLLTFAHSITEVYQCCCVQYCLLRLYCIWRVYAVHLIIVSTTEQYSSNKCIFSV